ncbi:MULTISPECIES: ABC transporter substrate-binding protein [Xanthobacter]|uniref:ABC transporter substrate-binding protein n=1 Tax=Xanthobacter TaxID=279 RepID=UPI002022BCE0|nr:ABC transporter substrate-binding protein [Xanthobacter aminoxidans]MCL8382916.1 ABC transporter substrate-binding protein [Xanthobacter aminoxidans]
MVDLYGHTVSRRRFLAGVTAATTLVATCRAVAVAAEPPLKIGVLADMSGPMMDFSGPGTVSSIQMAIEDFGGKVNGRSIELRTADNLNKPDVGLAISRKWYDEGVEAVFDVGMTSLALAVQTLTKERNKTVIFLSASSADLTRKNCSPNGIHWSHDNYSQAVGAIKDLQKQGGKSWYFITIDYAFGVNSERDATQIIKAGGGRVIGSSRHPWDAADFASQLLQAQGSGADVIALATTTGHAGAIIKQAREFGITETQILAPLSWSFPDVKALGLRSAQGIITGAPFYWDGDDASRAFAKRYHQRFGRMPNEVQASAYGAMIHYLKAASVVNSDDGAAVIAQMKKMAINDFMTKDGHIRPDGRVMRDILILQVKKPADSKSEWDIFKVVGRVPADEAFALPDPAACPLVK